MKVLVTGGAGFIGSFLAEALLLGGNQVTVIDDLSTGREENLTDLIKNSSFSFVKGDVADPALVDNLLSSCDVVYHLAASVGVMLLNEKPIQAIENNVRGVTNLLQTAAKFNRKVFYASSSEVYGKADSCVLSEDRDLSLGQSSIPRWGYGCTKALGEFLALSYYKQRGLPVVIGRFFNVCGPRQSGAYGMVLPRFIAAALRGAPITVYGNGAQTRSFIYITDAVSAMMKLLDCPSAVGEVFNIGNPQPITILELARFVKKITSSNSPIVLAPYAEVYGPDFEDMNYRVPDVTKLENTVGYQPLVKLDKMIEDVAVFWKNRLADKMI